MSAALAVENARAELRPPSQVVMLGLADEILALDAGIVREILDPVPMTRVAGARDFVPCLINVRGNVIPLADIRVRFGMPLTPNTADTRIVVIEVTVAGDTVVVGLIADKVYEVVEITCARIQTTPRLGIKWNPEFVQSIFEWNGEFIIVPDLNAILS